MTAMDRVATPLGYGLLVVGAALLVLPGPGLPFLLGGLALLARRRAWARRLRRRLLSHLAGLSRRWGAGRPAPHRGAPGRRKWRQRETAIPSTVSGTTNSIMTAEKAGSAS